MKRYVNELSKFRMNHVGFARNATKKFVYLGNESNKFSVSKIIDGKILPYCEGVLEKMDETELFDSCFVGDISSINENGLYIIECGNDKSRIFSVYDKIYDTVCRTLRQYFIWQRCGDDTGWYGNCHHGEKLVDKHGKVHHISGGHHQSGDLRKWTFGAASGVSCLSEYLRRTPPLWNKGDIEYDIAHSVKYYLSLISDEGYVFDSSFVPFDYDKEKCEGVGMNDYTAFFKPFMYFDTPAPTLGQFAVIRLLCSASKTLVGYDDELAQKAKDGALTVWNYMINEGLKLPPHDWEIYPPLGHFAFKQLLFDYFFEDSALTLATASHTAAFMYRMTNDKKIADFAAKALEKLCNLAVYDKDGTLLYFKLCEDENDSRTAENVTYFPTNIPLCIAECIETFTEHPDAEKWKKCAIACVKRYEKMALSNCYGRTTTKIKTDENKNNEWEYETSSSNDDLAKSALFLVKMCDICEKESCLATAQRLLDWLVGANPYDSSSIECVGFNQVRRADFGEFFPGTPQIPGAMGTELHPDVFNSHFGSEYDMPIVGDTLLAFGLFAAKFNS